MKQTVLNCIIAIVVTAGALLISASDGFTFSELGDDVNAICAPEVVYTGDCALCHTGGKGDPTEAKDAYLTGGTILTDYFCPDPGSDSGIAMPRNFNYEIKGIADFNGDGSPDILFRHRVNGAWIISLMQDGMVIEKNRVLLPIQNQELAGIEDFNRDGRADVLLRNTVTARWTLNLIDGTTVLHSSMMY